MYRLRQGVSHPELVEQTVWEVFEAEARPKLVPYAGRFDGFHAVPARYQDLSGALRQQQLLGRGQLCAEEITKLTERGRQK
jgi:hypothetical protein